MTDLPLQIVCPDCYTKNRLLKSKLDKKPLCGKCKKTIISTSPIIATDQNCNRFVSGNDLPLVIDFWAPWCGPCIQFAPIFTQMATQACFVKLDTEQNQKVAGVYNIRSIPTLIIFHHGKEIARISGVLSKLQFQQWLTQNLPRV
jgi:thioredoxin 2